MPEPTLTTKREVLDRLRYLRAHSDVTGDAINVAEIDAIAAWLRAACVRDAGHEDGCDDAACTAPHPCWHCGQRRAEGGGQ